MLTVKTSSRSFPPNPIFNKVKGDPDQSQRDENILEPFIKLCADSTSYFGKVFSTGLATYKCRFYFLCLYFSVLDSGHTCFSRDDLSQFVKNEFLAFDDHGSNVVANRLECLLFSVLINLEMKGILLLNSKESKK